MPASWLASRASSRSSHLLGTLSRRYLASKSADVPKASQLNKYAWRTGYTVIGLGALWATDKTYNASAVFRNFRTLWTVSYLNMLPLTETTLTRMKCAAITIDYKLNFTPEKSELIPQLHERVADRMYNLFTANGGLYIKIG